MHLLDALNNSLPEVFRAIDLMGVLLNGILGGKVARERNFDAVGFCILAIMTALAGGMIRDLLLTTRTGAPVAITDPYYLWFAIIGALVAMAFRMDSRAWSVLLGIADGMVLGCWSATGAIKTLDAGFAIMPAILLGIMTAIGGGMVRGEDEVRQGGGVDEPAHARTRRGLDDGPVLSHAVPAQAAGDEEEALDVPRRPKGGGDGARLVVVDAGGPNAALGVGGEGRGVAAGRNDVRPVHAAGEEGVDGAAAQGACRASDQCAHGP
mgnify:CR=1 FL=1